MGKSTEEKLFYYIKTGKLHRVRSLFKKYEPSHLTAFVDRKGRSPLHACCLLGDDAIMRLLLKKGADVRVQDNDGNTPIHFALKYAIQTMKFHAFDDLIVPLLKVCSGHVFDIKNNEGKTPRDYLTVLKRVHAQRREEEKAERKQRWRKEDEEMSKKQENLEWERKLQFEASQEHYCIYNQDDYHENPQESYDEWVERIVRERRRKTESSKQQKTNTSKRLEQEQQEQEAKERTKELEKEHEAYITRMSIQRQKLKLASSLTDYEKRCQEIFYSNAMSTLKFVDLPWPFEGDTKEMIDLLVKWSGLNSKQERKKFLKDQQVRWHPDKFLQKCGNRLHEEDREQIIDQVKELSQEINAILEGEI